MVIDKGLWSPCRLCGAKIQDLANINDVVKLKIENDKVLMYSMKANDTAVLALKSYILPTINYFDDFALFCSSHSLA